MPRGEYAGHLEKKGGKCAFCKDAEEGLDIRAYTYWVWRFSAFPYHKYHTLMAPKRHVVDLSELNSAELVELQTLFRDSDTRYRNSGIVGDDSEFGDQLFISWRTRSPLESARKQAVAHFHIHLYPRFNNGPDLVLDEHAHEIDMARLKN